MVIRDGVDLLEEQKMVPKQRRPGQFGGSQSSNIRTAWRAKGDVRPPSKGCAIIVVAAIGSIAIAAAAPITYWIM